MLTVFDKKFFLSIIIRKFVKILKLSNMTTSTTVSKTNGLTSEMINDFYTKNGSICNTIKYAQGFRVEYTSAPVKPILKKDANSVEAKQYALDLEEYEGEKELYKIAKDEYNKVDCKISNLIEDFIKEESGLNSIPKQYRAKVYSIAYSNRHSSGYNSVYNHLVDLVDIFN